MANVDLFSSAARLLLLFIELYATFKYDFSMAKEAIWLTQGYKITNN